MQRIILQSDALTVDFKGDKQEALNALKDVFISNKGILKRDPTAIKEHDFIKLFKSLKFLCDHATAEEVVNTLSDKKDAIIQLLNERVSASQKGMQPNLKHKYGKMKTFIENAYDQYETIASFRARTAEASQKSESEPLMSKEAEKEKEVPVVRPAGLAQLVRTGIDDQLEGLYTELIALEKEYNEMMKAPIFNGPDRLEFLRKIEANQRRVMEIEKQVMPLLDRWEEEYEKDFYKRNFSEEYVPRKYKKHLIEDLNKSMAALRLRLEAQGILVGDSPEMRKLTKLRLKLGRANPS